MHKLTHSKHIDSWIDDIRKLCKPKDIHWCNGSEDEYNSLCQKLVDSGTFIKLNPQVRPNCYLARSDPSDVARVENCTYICCKNKDDAGPNNNWCDPVVMKNKMDSLFDSCMKGRTMYIIPFCMGPLGGKFSKYGIQITDSAYVVVNLYIMTRMGDCVLKYLDNNCFLPCLHSVGMPLDDNDKDVSWPCNTTKYIVHFIDSPMSVMSYGSGYGGNALLSKKCFALRIASVLGKEDGWLAEHMLISSLVSPENKKYYFCAAFPSACGKTNLAMLKSTLLGWEVHCLGDDISWLHVDDNGIIRAINPEAGFFGVVPGTSYETNPYAMETISKNTIFTNVALTKNGDVWWQGMTNEPPRELIDWTGKKWFPELGTNPAHPNARYTTPANQCPIIDPDWDNPEGVPISAFIFGGRKANLIPLVTQAPSWDHGVFFASIISSEMTAASDGNIGQLRRDPFAMLPFCGYNMSDYFKHWLAFSNKLNVNHIPKIFYVNWFRKDNNGNFIWPGFGENIRVLKWICQRINNDNNYKETFFGYLPKTIDSKDIGSINNIDCILNVDDGNWLSEIEAIKMYYQRYESLPSELNNIINNLEQNFLAKA